MQTYIEYGVNHNTEKAMYQLKNELNYNAANKTGHHPYFCTLSLSKGLHLVRETL